jgi:PAS domain S-box-containing protein
VENSQTSRPPVKSRRTVTRDTRRDGTGSAVDGDAVERAAVERSADAQRLALLFDGLREHAVYLLDRDGMVSIWSVSAERMTGYGARQMLGRSFAQIHPPEAVAAGQPQRELELAAAGVRVGEFARRRADGSRYWVEREMTVLRDGPEVHGFAVVERDVTTRRHTEQQRQDSTLRLKAIVDTAVDGLVTINERGIMESANPAAERMFGWTAGEMVGRNVSMLMPEPDRSAHDGYLRRYLMTGERRVIGIGREVRGLRRDGTLFPMDLAISETPLPSGRRIFTGLLRDVSDRKRIEAALLTSDQRKDEFLAVLAHELRNPLAPISNALQVLKHAREQPQRVDAVREVMERQMHQLVRLIDDLLDVNRITRGKLHLRRARVELADVVGAAVESSRTAIDAPGHQLVVDLPSEPVWLEVDAMRIAQVISNLLANAARFTPAGGRIELRAHSDGESVRISVTDNGIGIARDSLARVFEIFAQLNEPRARASNSLGIGLALVRSLVEMHGGSVTAHSAGPGTGSCFAVNLPLASANEQQEGDVRRSASLPTGLRVLVVDDNIDAADTLAMLLRIFNHDVELAHDGIDALAVAARFRPALVLMDVSMPRMGGLEATRAMRAENWGKRIFICTLTGFGQDADRQRSADAGVDAHLVKPVAPEALQAVIAQARSRTSQLPSEGK